MRYVELMGLPGVGKSTFFRSLRQRHPSWVTMDALLSRPPSAPLIEGRPTLREYMRWLQGQPQPRRLAAGGVRIEADYGELLNFLWRLLSRCRGSPPPGSREAELSPFDVTYDWTWALRRLGAVLSVSSDSVCIMDEGLIHRVLTGVSWCANFDADDIDTFVRLSPAPLGVVRVVCDDFQELIERLVRRGGDPEFFRGLDEEGLRHWLCAVLKQEESMERALVSSGVPVLQLAAGVRTPSQREKLQDFVGKRLAVSRHQEAMADR